MSFGQALSTVLNEAVTRRPVIVLTRRGVTIEADHGRWMTDRGGHPFLALGIKPGIYEITDLNNNMHAFMMHERDFYAPPKWIPSEWQDGSGWDEPECGNCGEKQPNCRCGRKEYSMAGSVSNIRQQTCIRP